MKIKKFEQLEQLEQFVSETEYNVYNNDIDSSIKKFNTNNIVFKYYIAAVDDKIPWRRLSASDLKHALDKMRLLNKSTLNGEKYCIFEGAFKALTSEEVELRLNTNKYNL